MMIKKILPVLLVSMSLFNTSSKAKNIENALFITSDDMAYSSANLRIKNSVFTVDEQLGYGFSNRLMGNIGFLFKENLDTIGDGVTTANVGATLRLLNRGMIIDVIGRANYVVDDDIASEKRDSAAGAIKIGNHFDYVSIALTFASEEFDDNDDHGLSSDTKKSTSFDFTYQPNKRFSLNVGIEAYEYEEAEYDNSILKVQANFHRSNWILAPYANYDSEEKEFISGLKIDSKF